MQDYRVAFYSNVIMCIEYDKARASRAMNYEEMANFKTGYHLREADHMLSYYIISILTIHGYLIKGALAAESRRLNKSWTD